MAITSARSDSLDTPNPSLKRRLPSLPFLGQVLRAAPLEFDPVARRLRSAHTIADLRRIAHRRTPKGPFEYVDGAAEDEISLGRSRQAYRHVEFRPCALQDVSTVDTSTSLFGTEVPLPFGLGPTGFTRMLHAAGEIAVARAAATAGIPYALSSFGTTRYESLRSAAPSAKPWFQLYLLKDFERNLAVLDEVAAAGCETLVITVDTPTSGRRLRDLKNGMTFPPQLTAKTFLNASIRPEWWINLLTTEPLQFAYSGGGLDKTALTRMIDPSVTWSDIARIRSHWAGNLVIKGVQTVVDARSAVAAGADAVVLSNHGGRQLDRAPVPLHTLPSVVQELQGQSTIMVDSGIMNGADVVAALALGADFVLVGRAYLYGLMAAGEAGVQKATEILKGEIVRTMALLGAPTVADLNPAHVRLPRSDA